MRGGRKRPRAPAHHTATPWRRGTAHKGAGKPVCSKAPHTEKEARVAKASHCVIAQNVNVIVRVSFDTSGATTERAVNGPPQGDGRASPRAPFCMASRVAGPKGGRNLKSTWLHFCRAGSSRDLGAGHNACKPSRLQMRMLFRAPNTVHGSKAAEHTCCS